MDGGTIYYYGLTLGRVEVRRVAPDGSGDASLGAAGLTPAVMPGGRVAFSQPRIGMDLPAGATPQAVRDQALNMLRTGRIFSVAPDGTGLRPESDTTRSYFAPDFDRSSARMVAHGAGPVDGVIADARVIDDRPAMHPGWLFAPPDARSRAVLADRTIEVRGIRGYLPAITADGKVLSTPLHFRGSPPAPLQVPSLDGAGLRALFTPDSGIAWGAAVARDARTTVVAVGPPFADGSASVDI